MTTASVYTINHVGKM